MVPRGREEVVSSGMQGQACDGSIVSTNQLQGLGSSNIPHTNLKIKVYEFREHLKVLLV